MACRISACLFCFFNVYQEIIKGKADFSHIPVAWKRMCKGVIGEFRRHGVASSYAFRKIYAEIHLWNRLFCLKNLWQKKCLLTFATEKRNNSPLWVAPWKYGKRSEHLPLGKGNSFSSISFRVSSNNIRFFPTVHNISYKVIVFFR